MSNFRILFPWLKKLGKPIVLWDIGIGPLSTPRSLDWARKILSFADMITARDEESYIWLKKLDIKPRFITRSADPVWLVEPNLDSGLIELEKNRIKVEIPYAAFNITNITKSFSGRKVSIEKLKSVIDSSIKTLKKDYSVRLVPTSKSDINFCSSFVKANKDINILPSFQLSPNGVVSFLGR